MLFLTMIINEYEKWIGTRQELISIIKLIENKYPKKYKMFSKQLGKVITVNDRRIQQFIDINILPKPSIENKKYLYSFVHLIRYLSAIILRNKGYPLNIIKENLDLNDFDFLKDEFVYGKVDKDFLKKEDVKVIELSHRLKSLGRKEGKVLNISQKKLAITPWCTVLINENKLQGLKPEDIDTLTEAMSSSLKDLLK